jgi:hypothetical protein
VGDVFDAVLGADQSPYDAAHNFPVSYQTIRWWLNGLAGNRQCKASCFPGRALNRHYRSSCREWCVHLWHSLRKAFKGTPEHTLIKGTCALLTATNRPLY